MRRTAAHVESNARGCEWVNHDRYAVSLLENAESCRAIGEAEKADKYEAEAQRLKRIGEKGCDICQKFEHPVKFRVQRAGRWALGITVGLVVAGIVGAIIGWLQVSLFTLLAQASGVDTSLDVLFINKEQLGRIQWWFSGIGGVVFVVVVLWIIKRDVDREKRQLQGH